MQCTECFRKTDINVFKKIDVIINVLGISEILISFCNLITWPILFNWNHFEMKLLILRINFYLLRFIHILPKLARDLLGQKRCCDRQLWKAVITGDTVTRLSIPIWGRVKITWRRPEMKFGWNVVKEETTQKLPRWGQKVRNK